MVSSAHAPNLSRRSQKYNAPIQPYYWLCGYAVDQESLATLDAAARDVARWYFDTGQLGAKTEFHGEHIVNGKGNFKGHDVSSRIELYNKLVDCLCCHDSIKRIEVRIDPAKITHEKDPAQAAFMFFVEKCDVLMRALRSTGVLIADDDSKQVRSSNVAHLSSYREWTTDWHFGKKIEHLVDTIHHTQSHHSRMVQLADIYVYSCQLQGKEELNYIKSQIFKHACEQGLYNATKYKHWPTSDSFWYKEKPTK